MFAKTKVLDDEDERDYQSLKDAWRAEIQPQDLGGGRLVELLVDADWLLKRADRRLKAVEATEWQAEDGDEKEWAADEAQQLALLQRYYSPALRNYLKLWKETGPAGRRMS